MRLHRLAVRAFGPFAGEEEVDFDALSASGLFLLHGPTGAGKTSVLDAVCFALYGAVPGARATTTRYRSDHAAEGVAPQVVCEFSVGARRLEVTRSPAWERPKRRGTGTTTEQARVLVRERVEGRWTALTTRIDEAAHLLEDLLGMGQAQFTKLVLLPQGDFAAFLRADAETRRQMLERLFDTDRFSEVQQWLREEAQQARRQVDEARTVTRELLARAEQAAVPGTTPGTAPDDPPGPDPAPPRQRVAALLAAATRDWEDATAARAATQERLQRARAACDDAVRRARHHTDHARLAAARDRLVADGPAQEERLRRLRDAERALGLAEVAPALTDAETRLERARPALDVAVAQAAADGDALGAGSPLAAALALRGAAALDPTVLAGLPDAAIADQAGALRGAVGHLQALAVDAARLDAARSTLRLLAAGADGARRSLDDALAGAAARGPALAVEQAQLDRARTVAAGLPAAEQALAAADALAAAARDRDAVRDATRRALPERQRARDARDTARQRWLDCRERRLDQMAAELAEALAEGGSCPVCGSTAHPDPAVPGPGRVTEAQEELARDAYERADAAWTALEEIAAQLAERLAARTATAGEIPVADAVERQARARADVAAARHAADGLAGRVGTVAALTESVARGEQAVETARATAQELATRLAAEHATVAELAARLDAARGDDADLATRTARLAASADRLEAVLEARREHADALRAAATARGTALAAVRTAGFGDLDAAVAAVVPERRRRELDAAARAHAGELAAVTAQLRDPDLVAAAAGPVPDVARLQAAVVQAAGDDEAYARRIAVAEHAVAELRRIEGDLAAHLAVAEPLEGRHHRLAELARCADGTGGDNARRMSLSAYVLAARLEQVAQAASARLAHMSGGRYTLRHSDGPTRGQRRAGLGLHVLDAWTGRERDTATLSGGESFYTSLALALGLADVVSAEAGGTAIETLFVDEGFGSLDEDTLEEVMDVLDGLRSGGRTVGLVSHLADLRYRIPAQIEVVKGRDGSRLAVAAGANA